jgi:hypothetical protein
MKAAYRAEVPPIHEHQWGFRVEGRPPSYYSILRNPDSEAVWVDPRFREHELRLRGRLFPGSSVVELSRWMWYRDGVLMDVYYWCEVCSIRGVAPGPCACCQGKVELREAPLEEPKGK